MFYQERYIIILPRKIHYYFTIITLFDVRSPHFCRNYIMCRFLNLLHQLLPFLKLFLLNLLPISDVFLGKNNYMKLQKENTKKMF